MNPFQFGGPVESDYYFAQPELRNAITAFLDNRTSVVLLGPRRHGKTSFILDLFKHFESRKKPTETLFVDVFNITNHKDFLRQLLYALRKKQSGVQKLKQVSEEDTKQLILETLDSLNTLAPRLCVAFDEFQRVGQLEDGFWLEATLRSAMQQAKQTSFLFSGSRRSVIHQMFNDQSRAFYRSCQLIDFPIFGEGFTTWIIERFKKAGLTVDSEIIKYIRDLVADTPHYVQMICFNIVAAGHQKVSKKTVEDTLNTVINQNSYAYQTLLSTVSPVHQRVLRMAAIEKDSVFSKENLARYDIKSPSHVSQAINSLKSKQILDEGSASGKVIFDDPLFTLWLQREIKETN